MRRVSSTAFSLVEITLALGVASVSLLAVAGLLATGARTNRAATEQSASVDLLTAIAGDLRATPPTDPTSMQFGIPIPSNSAGSSTTLYFDSTGQSSTALSDRSRYRVVITFISNAGGRLATFVDLRVSWPAVADPANPATGAAEIFVALDRS